MQVPTINDMLPITSLTNSNIRNDVGHTVNQFDLAGDNDDQAMQRPLVGANNSCFSPTEKKVIRGVTGFAFLASSVGFSWLGFGEVATPSTFFQGRGCDLNSTGLDYSYTVHFYNDPYYVEPQTWHCPNEIPKSKLDTDVTYFRSDFYPGHSDAYRNLYHMDISYGGPGSLSKAGINTGLVAACTLGACAVTTGAIKGLHALGLHF